MTAIKTIRICQLNWLEELFKNEKFDLKVIHLIRDPRAIAQSRRALPIHKNFTDKQLAKNITDLCKNQLERNGVKSKK